jgi:hypothetical protein
MGGPAKRRAHTEQQAASSSGGSSSASRDPTQRSEPKSIPRLDGNRDPGAGRIPTEYSKPTDLKNISEALGLGGWYAARGVSANSLLLSRVPSLSVRRLASWTPRHPLHLRLRTLFPWEGYIRGLSASVYSFFFVSRHTLFSHTLIVSTPLYTNYPHPSSSIVRDGAATPVSRHSRSPSVSSL